jgi:uncharacterized protein YjfI (DUF2170 family)
MAPKKPAYYQSKYRERLRERGYVKREVWIPPVYTKILKDCETALRDDVMPIIPRTFTERKMSKDDNWTTESLLEALKQSEPVTAGDIEVSLVEGADSGILVTMKEFGDLPLVMSVSGSQIIVDTLLWPVEEAGDSAAFNEMILKTHKLFPLSTFGIVTGPDGRDYYEMFGSLSAGSILETVIFEIETLADNTMQAAEAYQSELKNVA